MEIKLLFSQLVDILSSVTITGSCCRRANGASAWMLVGRPDPNWTACPQQKKSKHLFSLFCRLALGTLQVTIDVGPVAIPTKCVHTSPQKQIFFNSDLTRASRHVFPLSASPGNHSEKIQSPWLQVFEVTDKLRSGLSVLLAEGGPNLRALRHQEAEVTGLNAAAGEPDQERVGGGGDLSPIG